MRNYPEEPLEQQGSAAGEDNGAVESPSQGTDAAAKIRAIKDALRQQEEQRRQEESKAQIAEKIRLMKAAMAEAEEKAEEPPQEPPDDDGSTPEVPEPEDPEKKKKKKRKSFGKRFRELFPQKGDGVFESVRKIVFLLSSVTFVVCMCMIGKYFWDSYQNRLLQAEITDAVNSHKQETTEPPTDTTEDVYEVYSLLPEAEYLLSMNPDTVGYIQIPETEIYYPVVQRRDDENQYYLTRNFFGDTAKAGSIFLDYRNKFDYVEDGRKIYENSQNLIIYGHNMHDYSMFGSLKYYINNVHYYDEHPIVELNSNYRYYQYKIFGMIIVDVDDETDTRFDYWNKLNFDDEKDFYDYVNEIKRRSVRLTDVDVKYGDQLLTLSTCNSTFSEGRLAVFARLVRPGEDLMEGCTSEANPNIKWPNSYYRWHKKTYDPDAEFEPYG